jgi:vitamin B12 transporter
VPIAVQNLPDYSGEAYINAGTVKFSGFEALGDARITDALRLEASFTHSKAQGANGLQTDRIPKDYGRAGLTWTPGGSRFGGGVQVNWTGDDFSTVSGVRSNIGNYATVDLNAHAWLDEARKTRVIVSLQNAFDKDYAVRLRSAPTDSGTPASFVYGYRGAPRVLSVRLNYVFGG